MLGYRGGAFLQREDSAPALGEQGQCSWGAGSPEGVGVRQTLAGVAGGLTAPQLGLPLGIVRRNVM